MRQPRGDADLAQESLGADRSGQLLTQYLDRDLPAVLTLLREMNGGHATVSDQTLDAVALVERRRRREAGIGRSFRRQWRMCQSYRTPLIAVDGERNAVFS